MGQSRGDGPLTRPPALLRSPGRDRIHWISWEPPVEVSDITSCSGRLRRLTDKSN